MATESGAQATEMEPQQPSMLLRRIQDKLNDANPLIGSVLGRSSGIGLSGQTIVFKFPASAGIFAERVRDPEVLKLLSRAAREELGRDVIARVETDPNAVTPAQSASPGQLAAAAQRDEVTRPDAAARAPVAPPSDPVAVVQPAEPAQTPPSAGEPVGVEPEAEAATPATPAPVGQRADDPTLRARAEGDEQVQEFLRALKGTITTVEEPRT